MSPLARHFTLAIFIAFVAALEAAPKTASLRPHLDRVYGFALPKVIEAKQAYAVSHGLSVWADYRLIDTPVPVLVERHSLQSQLRRTRGFYHPGIHSITIHEGEGDHVLVHELGHALQRKAVLEYRTGPTEGLTLLLKDTVDPKTLDRRLCYLLLQSELEVRLMQLNRAFFKVYGRPILDRQDAYLALVCAGYRFDRATRMELRVFEPNRKEIRRFDSTENSDLRDMLTTLRQADGDDDSWRVPALDAILTLAPAVL